MVRSESMSLQRLQIPVAIALVVVVVLNHVTGLGIALEGLLALAATAGALGVPRLSERHATALLARERRERAWGSRNGSGRDSGPLGE